jgi:hypothetical protein
MTVQDFCLGFFLMIEIDCPACLLGKSKLSQPLTLPSLHLSKPKRPEFARTAFHWKIFSSSIEMRNPDLLKPRFTFGSLIRANIHPSNPKDDSDELSCACLLGNSKPSQSKQHFDDRDGLPCLSLG